MCALLNLVETYRDGCVELTSHLAKRGTKVTIVTNGNIGFFFVRLLMVESMFLDFVVYGLCDFVDEHVLSI